MLLVGLATVTQDRILFSNACPEKAGRISDLRVIRNPVKA